MDRKILEWMGDVDNEYLEESESAADYKNGGNCTPQKKAKKKRQRLYRKATALTAAAAAILLVISFVFLQGNERPATIPTEPKGEELQTIETQTLQSLTPESTETVSEEIAMSFDEAQNEPGIIHVESGRVNKEDVIKAFFGLSQEEAKPYRPSSYFEYIKSQGGTEGMQDIYEKDGSTLIITTETISGNEIIHFSTPSADHYIALYSQLKLLDEGLDAGLRDILPEEELPDCSREDAVAACSEAMAACGYQDADISVYALSLKRIEELRETGGLSVIMPDAPDPSVMPSTLEDIYKTKFLVQAAEKDGNQEKAQELRLQEAKLWEQINIDKKTGLPWEKKHEGFLIICRPRLDGLVMDSLVQRMEIIYVPETGIVYVSANTPYRQKGTSEQADLITAEKAITATMQLLGLEEEELEVIDTSLVYSVRATQAASEDPTVNPCWRVDYRMLVKRAGTSTGRGATIWIDAVTCVQSRYSEVW